MSNIYNYIDYNITEPSSTTLKKLYIIGSELSLNKRVLIVYLVMNINKITSHVDQSHQSL